MKKYTIEEKEMLLAGLDSYIDADRINRRVLTGEGKDEWIRIVTKFEELRAKLILDIAPIQIREASDLMKIPCILCGELTRGGSPTWGFVDNKKVCHECFEKHDLEGFKKVTESNKDYWMKEHPDDFNPDGTFKNKMSVNDDDSLLFDKKYKDIEAPFPDTGESRPL